MTDYTELKHAAEAALSLRHEDCESAQQHSRMAALYRVSFGQKASPEAILALIAENEQFRVDRANAMDDACLIASERDQLKAEVEALRKDAECLEKAAAFVQKLRDAAGNQQSVATGYLQDILSVMSKEAGHD